MAVITASATPTHNLPGARFTALATPSRGSAETSVWQVEIAPGTPATPHTLTREEILVILSGRADVRIGTHRAQAFPGDAVVVPRDTPFELANTLDEPLQALCCLPVGGQGRLSDGILFVPPWAQ